MNTSKFILLCAVLTGFVVVASSSSASEDDINPRDQLLSEYDLETSTKFSTELIEHEYRNKLRDFDKAIEEHPKNVQLEIARCDFMQDFAYKWEYTEGFEHLYDESSQCDEELENKFAYHPEVKLRKLNYLHGEEFFEGALAEEEAIVDVVWTTAQKSRLYEMLAFRYAYENVPLAISYGEKALELDKGSKVRLKLASLHSQTDGNERAQEIAQYALLQLDELKPEDLSVLLSIYANINDKEKVQRVYQKMAEEREGGSVQVAQYLARVGLYTEASEEFSRLGEILYDTEQVNFERFKFEFDNGPKEAALSAYEALRDNGIWADPIGSNRIALFIKYPDLPWSWRDIGGVFLSIPAAIFVVLALGIPFCVIHYGALVYSRWKNMELPAAGWGLTSAWIAFSCIMLGLTIPFLILGPSDLSGDFNWYGADLAADKAFIAQATMLGSILSIALLLPLARSWKVIENQWLSKRSSVVLAILAGIGVGVAFRLPVIASFEFIPEITEHFTRFTEQGSVINAVNDTYGWLATVWLLVIAAPVIEEFAFRGAILGGLQRYLPFYAANVIQAVLFAMVHTLESSLSVFYIFALGLVFGVLRRKYDGLLVPIICHATFNGILTFLLLG